MNNSKVVLTILFSIITVCLFLTTTTTHAETNEVGRKFLEEKKNETGVIALELLGDESGGSLLLYKKILPHGGTNKIPKLDTNCLIHYDVKGYITKLDFDSSFDRKRPILISPRQVGDDGGIDGLKEALLLMKEGERWELYISSELAYGDDGNRSFLNKGWGFPIPGKEVLIVTIELLEVMDNDDDDENNNQEL